MIDYTKFAEFINNNNNDTKLVFMVGLIAFSVAIVFLIYYNVNTRD